MLWTRPGAKGELNWERDGSHYVGCPVCDGAPVRAPILGPGTHDCHTIIMHLEANCFDGGTEILVNLGRVLLKVGNN